MLNVLARLYCLLYNNTMDYREKAESLFLEGYNCAQSVFCAFCDDLGIDFETALKMSSSFGGGMGRLREVCGTVSAMFLIAGLKYGYTEPNNTTVKAEHYARIQELAEEFRAKHGTIICRELLGLDVQQQSPVPEERTAEYYQKRPCKNFVGDAAELIAGYIRRNG